MYKSNGLSSFFPVENLFYSKEIFNHKPVWEYLKGEGSSKKIRFKTNSLPAGLTHLNHEIYIDTIDLNITKIITDGIFGEIGNMYSEQKFTDFKPFPRESAIKLDYFKTFSIDYGDSIEIKQNEKIETKISADIRVFNTDSVNLITLDGQSFQLPK